jgi:tetratricopeptide (TPR) repeat protein
VTPDASAQREQDLVSALELRARLDRALRPEWIPMSAMRMCFGGHRLTRSRKRAIVRALLEAGIDIYPELDRLRTRDEVRLEVKHAGRGQPEQVRPRWKQLRAKALSPAGRVFTALGTVGSIAGLVSLFLAGGVATHSHVTRMTGDLNIAIAPFASHGVATPEGVALARATAGTLRSQLPRLDRSLDMEIRGPDELGRSDIADIHSAQALTRMIGADIVVYGDLEATAQVTRLVPVFYLNAEKLPSATALSGRYGYGQAISLPYSIDVSPQARAAVRAALVRRTGVYAAAFVGIGYYLQHSLRSADRYLLLALGASPSQSSLSLLNLLLGNVADQQGDSGDAIRYYTSASHAQATHARAEFGLAEVTYRTSSHECRPGSARRAGLLGARAAFSRVLQGPGADVAEAADPALTGKVEFGLGQVDLCLSASREASAWERARQEFSAVTRVYKPALPDLRDDAAEAYAGIGLCDLTLENPPKSYMDARANYDLALEKTTIRRRKAYFEGVVGFADEQLGHHIAAAREYRRAARLAVGTEAARTFAIEAARAEDHR